LPISRQQGTPGPSNQTVPPKPAPKSAASPSTSPQPAELPRSPWKSIHRALVSQRTFFTLAVPVLLVIFARPKSGWLPWGLALALLGEMLRFWAAGHLTKSTQLTTSGPFAHLRHPLYLGSLLIATGYCLMTGLWLSFPIVLALFALFFLSAMFYEQDFLQSSFGDEYRRYKAHTPLLLPRITAYPGPRRRFSWQQFIVNREHRVALSVIVFSALFIVRWVLAK